jgi:GxxExxY protein
MSENPDQGFNALTERIIGAAIEVHRELGPGLLEAVYEECLCVELKSRGLAFQRQIQLPVQYKGARVDCGFRLDLLVEGRVVLELKAVEQVLAVHKSQLLTYLRLTGHKLGLLLNFNVPFMTSGIHRVVNTL